MLFNQKTHVLCSYFNLAAGGTNWLFVDVLVFSARPLLFLLLAFSFSPFALFFLMCRWTVPFCWSSFCSPAGSRSCFSVLAGVLPLFFIKIRGVVEIVLRVGGFFSSLRLALLNIKKKKCKWTVTKAMRCRTVFNELFMLFPIRRKTEGIIVFTWLSFWSQPCSPVQDTPPALWH